MEYRKEFMYAASLIVALTTLPRAHGLMNYITPILAGTGAYGTYQTLTAQSHIADSCKHFVNAMRKDTAGCGEYLSVPLRAFLLNFPKYFKRHEKIALVASGTALVLGGTLLCLNTVAAM